MTFAIAVLLRRLADDVGVEQPAHSFRRFGGLAPPRRHVVRADRALLHHREPVLAPAEATEHDRVFFGVEVRVEVVARLGRCEAVGTVSRRLASSVTTMVGLSHQRRNAVNCRSADSSKGMQISLGRGALEHINVG